VEASVIGRKSVRVTKTVRAPSSEVPRNLMRERSVSSHAFGGTAIQLDSFALGVPYTKRGREVDRWASVAPKIASSKK